AAAASATIPRKRSARRTPASARARSSASSRTLSYAASVVGRYARQAAAPGEGEVRAVFRRSCYAWFAGGGYACIGDPSLGCGPLNALVPDFRIPSLGERVTLDIAAARLWTPAPLAYHLDPDLQALRAAARGRVPREGLGCLVGDAHNSLSGHAQPAPRAIERRLVGNAPDGRAPAPVGPGPAPPPARGEYLAG